MLIPVDKFRKNTFPWQLKVLKAFDRKAQRFFLLKCHRRARKTTLILNLLIRECIRNPNSVYPYVGPTYTQAKSIVWRDPKMLFSYLPPKEEIAWESNESELFIKFPNGSILPIKGGDQPDSLRGIDANGVGFDEWAQMKKEIWTEIFRPIMTQDESRWAMFAYTPKGVTHATEMERASEEWDDWYKIVLKASESGIMSQKELDKARRETPPWLYDQEYECADITDEEMTLITSRLLDSLRNSKTSYKGVKEIVSCDPDCSVSGDECVIYAFNNTTIIDEDIFHERDTDKIAYRVGLMADKHKIPNVIVDSIGIGKGVRDQLVKSRRYNVNSFDSREVAIEKNRFFNKRAESWWYVMEQMNDKKVDYPKDIMLLQDLSSVKVRPASKKIQLELKIDTKKRLGRSPDRGDAFIMGIYGQRMIEPRQERTEFSLEDPWAKEDEATLAYTVKTEL